MAVLSVTGHKAKTRMKSEAGRYDELYTDDGDGNKQRIIIDTAQPRENPINET